MKKSPDRISAEVTSDKIKLVNDIDLNSLFNLNYNFDLLKGIIEKLLKNQQKLQKQIDSMKDEQKELKLLKNDLNTTKEELNKINQIFQIDDNNEKDKDKYKDKSNEVNMNKSSFGKNFEQLKNQILELQKESEKTKQDLNKHNENIYLLNNKCEKIKDEAGEDKSLLNDKINDLENKILLLLGDVKPEELENAEKFKEKKAEEERQKKATIEQINRKLAQLDSNKIDTAIFDMKNDKFYNRLEDVQNKLHRLIFNLYGYTGDQYDIPEDIKFLREDEYKKYKINIENEFRKILEEIKKLKERIESIKEEIKDNCKHKDIEVNNNYIFRKMDELIEGLNKKFVFKSENSNALKNLEDQFKRIVLLLATKIEHENNNWLLAKKPINGYSCAACENYIGDLKEEKNDKYLTWKKLPLREREKESEQEKDKDKLYRLGNGYSHILKMVGVDSSGNVSLNPNSNKDLKILFPGNNEINKIKEGFDIKIKKNTIPERSESARKTYQVIRTKNNERKLPKIRGSTLTIDDFDKIIDNPYNTLNQNDNVISPKITKILKKSYSKLNL